MGAAEEMLETFKRVDRELNRHVAKFKNDNKTRKLWIDMPVNEKAPATDDFIVAMSRTKSNSVYLVASARQVLRKVPCLTKRRIAMEVYVVDLATLLRRDADQRIFTMYWYPRTKRPNTTP